MRQKVVALLGIAIALAIGLRWHYPWQLDGEASAPPYLFGPGSFVEARVPPDTVWQVKQSGTGSYEAGAEGRLAEFRCYGGRVWRYTSDSAAVSQPVSGRLVAGKLQIGEQTRRGLVIDPDDGLLGWRMLIPLAAGLWGLALLVSKRKPAGGTEKASKA